MDYRIIKSPTLGTMDMLNRRRALARTIDDVVHYDAVGLVQGKLLDMVAAADVAEKAASVNVEEIRGLCPQHFSMIGIFGDTASVEAAIKAIQCMESDERRSV